MKLKFEQVPREDGLQEEKVVIKGKDQAPLRRAVGMPAFAGSTEQATYMAKAERRLPLERGMALRRAKLKLELEVGLRRVLEEHSEEHSLASAIFNFVNTTEAGNYPVAVEVSPEQKGFALTIRSEKYGDINIKMQEKS